MPSRILLDKKIQHLLDEILIMDSMVENATLEAVDALKNRDLELAKQVYANDKLINQKRFDLENDIIVTIATVQPIMAGDLRLIASILEVVGELERMGDYAKGIANICLKIGNQPHVKPLIDIPRMAELAKAMVKDSINAFVNKDDRLAKNVCERDDEVDKLNDQIFRELLTYMMQDPTTIERAVDLILVGRHLERTADHATNISEDVIYYVKGKTIKHHCETRLMETEEEPTGEIEK